MFITVVIKFIAPKIEDAPAKCKLKIAKSTEPPEWLSIPDNGGYTVQPVPAPTSTKEEDNNKVQLNSSLCQVGHTCEEMIKFILDLDPKLIKDKNIIISGGLKRPLDGVLLKSMIEGSGIQSSLMGFASLFLKHAQGEYSELKEFMNDFQDSFLIANNLIERK